MTSASNAVQTHLSPIENGFRLPAEWTPHEAVWLAWPSAKNLWQENLQAAQNEFIAFARAIRDLDANTGTARGEKLKILVPGANELSIAREALSDLEPEFFVIPFGDIWLRDTAPLFLTDDKNRSATAEFKFNGWGGKYTLPHDAELASKIAGTDPKRPNFKIPLVLEGGSIELDGRGTCLTSRQCLLNPNRNPGLDQIRIEAALKSSVGVENIIWVGDGLLNDHTDGHIDTIARFAPGKKILCMKALDSDDPNRLVLEQIASDLRAAKDVEGNAFEVVELPSPGLVLDDDGEVMPASYVNFYIANTTVIVPTYGKKWDDEAVRIIATCFPKHRVVGLSAKAILSGGGAFHCISQQQPS